MLKARVNSSGAAKAGASDWLEVVRQQVATLQFGVVQIIVHESKVVQVERTEKLRFASPTASKNLNANQATGGGTIHTDSLT